MRRTMMNAYSNKEAFKTDPGAKSALSERALLATLRCKQWTARKKDKAVTAETSDRYRTKDDAVSVTKKLIQCEELEAVSKIITAAGETHRTLTLPWLDGPRGAPRILAVQAYAKYVDAMRVHREALEDAVRALAAVYPHARAAARRSLLGSMFDDEDYPEDISDRFAITTSLSPVPDARDWRVDLGDDSVAILRADVQAQADEAINSAVRDAYERVAVVVGKLAEKLRAYPPEPKIGSGPKKGDFKGTLVSNVADLAEILPLLNITPDPKLDAIAKRMRDELTHIDPEELKAWPHLRKEVTRNAEAILADIAGFMG